MDTNTQEKERQIGFEIMRLMHLSRDEGVHDLVDAALAGRPKTPESVAKLFNFVLRGFGDDSAVVDRFWNSCSAYLSDTMNKQQLNAVRNPFPKYGEPGFKSILDEMEKEGRS